MWYRGSIIKIKAFKPAFKARFANIGNITRMSDDNLAKKRCSNFTFRNFQDVVMAQ